VFAGDETGTPWVSTGSGATLDFTAPATASPARTVEIGPGQVVQPVHHGNRVFVDSGALGALRDLVLATRGAGTSGNPAADVRGTIGSLDRAFDDVQGLVGETGARANALQMTTANLDAFETGMKARKSELQEADFEQAVTDLASKQAAYQAAMLATSKVLGMSLADYLR
jgi:flagellar hook-associated protein 3 FlgL